MKTYKIVEIMGNFSVLVDTTIQAHDEKEAKEKAMQEVKKILDNYMYAVVEEVKGE